MVLERELIRIPFALTSRSALSTWNLSSMSPAVVTTMNRIVPLGGQASGLSP
jgi:hypothetical protein